MKRTFVGGSGAERRFVQIEVSGQRLQVLQKKGDGAIKRNVKELTSEGEARSESERMIRDLLARGYVEQAAAGTAKPKARAAAPAREEEGLLGALADMESDAPAAPVLSRLGAPPAATAARAAEAAPKKKTGGKKKKKKKGKSEGDLDKRVLFGIAAVGVAIMGLIGYVVYDGFIKAPSIVGTWKGSMVEHEIGKFLRKTEYGLILDEKKRAVLTVENDTTQGTYVVKGDRLKLTMKDEDGNPDDREYKFSLGRSTLDLFDPATGKQAVQLIRFREPAVIRNAGGEKKEKEAPQDLVAEAAGPGDKAADERLASVQFGPKDGAWQCRHPKGWETDTGSRPDNSYSWGSFTNGSAKIEVRADVAGSLMSGSDVARNVEEGSELAPVHRAHEHYLKTLTDELGDYKESKPTLFKGSGLGEGRISTFTASGGGLFGGKLRGYHVTLLTNDRRVTVLCQCPTGEFEKLKPTFLAVARSVSR